MGSDPLTHRHAVRNTLTHRIAVPPLPRGEGFLYLLLPLEEPAGPRGEGKTARCARPRPVLCYLFPSGEGGPRRAFSSVGAGRMGGYFHPSNCRFPCGA